MTAMSLGGRITQAIRCTFPKCKCECFSSTKNLIRTCQSCKHGWVAHAVDKLMSLSNPFSGVGVQIEPISPSIVFDIASLILYGCQAIPIRLKMCLDRLFSALQHGEVLQILHGFGWSYEDYARGYILQDPNGRVLEKFCIITREEEGVVLQQFVRFSETRSISQDFIVQDTKSTQQDVNNSPAQPNQAKSDSDIRKFIERNNMALIQSYNLALRRAFDSPQSILSAMGGAFPPHLNMAAAASQFGRGFPGPAGGMLPMPTAGFPQSADPKPEPIIAADQSATRRSSSEPFDLSKRSPESHSKSSSPVSSVTGGNNSNTAPSFPKSERHDSKPELNENDVTMRNEMMKQPVSSPSPTASRRPPGTSSSEQGWPFNNPAFGQTVFVTSSGKKRVLCTACNKTFCDKGALKIHYSAVHLKEMHKCTIPGCNMMFSSRRSRNRHSANPNPKLHTPQTRRPRERYEAEQDRIMAMMGMPPGVKMEMDGGSSVDESDRGEMSQDNINGREISGMTYDDDPQEGEDFNEDMEMGDDLPTQIRQDSPLYRNNKRKRLMPTRLPSSPLQAVIDEDVRSENGRSVSSGGSRVEDEDAIGGAGDGVRFNEKELVDRNREPGEVCTRSPAEPGEVIRKDDIETNLVPKFPQLTSPSSQVSVMQSLFSSFLPQNKTDNHGNAFWSSFIQQTAAAQSAAQNAAANEELNIEDDSDDESENEALLNGSGDGYRCTIDGCDLPFPTKEARDMHSMNIKLHCNMFENNHAISNGQQSRSQRQCIFCDKSFPTEDVLTKHIHTAHQGQESMFSEKNFSTQLDSIKAKTPVIA